jgi:hypothetical protein
VVISLTCSRWKQKTFLNKFGNLDGYAEGGLGARRRSWTRSWRRSWSRCSGRCWRWRATCGCLDCNHHRRTLFEEPYRGIGSLWRLIGVEPEIIQCPPSNGVRVLVLRKHFRVPSNRIGGRSNIPGCAAISCISLGTIMCPTGMLRRSMETDVA